MDRKMKQYIMFLYNTIVYDDGKGKFHLTAYKISIKKHSRAKPHKHMLDIIETYLEIKNIYVKMKMVIIMDIECTLI